MQVESCLRSCAEYEYQNQGVVTSEMLYSLIVGPDFNRSATEIIKERINN